MPLLAYNLTASPVVLTGVTPVVTLPAATALPYPGNAVNVTSELRGLSSVAYQALQTQAVGVVRYLWSTGFAEYATPGLFPVDSDATKVISSDTTIYVTTTGSDSTGDGSVGAPFLTIQRAMNYLNQFRIQANVVVQVGAGTFDGFALQTQAEYLPTNGSLSLRVLGTLTELDPGGSQTGYSRTGVVGTMTDSGKAFTVNAFVDKFIERTISGTKFYYPIISNTATTILFSTGNTSFTDPTYRVVDLATQIGPASAAQFPGSATVGTVIVMNDCTMPAKATIELCAVTAAASGRAVDFTNGTSAAQLKYCRLVGTGSGSVINLAEGSLLMQGCLLNSNGSAIGVAMTTGGRRARALSTSECTARNATGGVSVFTIGSNSSVSLANTYIASASIGVSVFDGAKVAAGVQLESCTTGISLSNRGIVSLGSTSGSTIFGSGNTTAISCNSGSQLRLSASSTITGTTELSVDGVAGTIAAMRAASPKIFPTTANAYGSYVFE